MKAARQRSRAHVTNPLSSASILLSVAVVLCLVGVAPPAHATTAVADTSWSEQEVDPAQIKDDLHASTLKRTSEVVDGIPFETYRLSRDASVSVSTTTDGATTRLGAGTSPQVFITLNRTDQEALRNGAAAALGVGLCAIPAVGWAACAGILAVLAIAATYIRGHGLCPTSRPQLKVFLGTGVFGCVR